MTTKNILFTFVGSNDPFDKGKKSELSNENSTDTEQTETKDGPILSLLKYKEKKDKSYDEFVIKFDQVYIFVNDSEKNKEWANATKKQIETEVKNNKSKTIQNQEIPIELKVELVNIEDKGAPTDHISLLKALYPKIQKKLDENKKANFYISIVSGTPAMHAIWFMLVAGNEINNAKILQMTRKEEAKDESQILKEISTTKILKSARFTQGLLQETNLDNDKKLYSRIKTLDLIPLGLHSGLDEIYKLVFSFRRKNIILKGKVGSGKKTLAELYAKCNDDKYKLNIFDLDEKIDIAKLKDCLNQDTSILQIKSLDFLKNKEIKKSIIDKQNNPLNRMALIVDDKTYTSELDEFFKNDLESCESITLGDSLGLDYPFLDNATKPEIANRLAIKNSLKNIDEEDFKKCIKMLNQSTLGELVDILKKAHEKTDSEKIDCESFQNALNKNSDKSFQVSCLDLDISSTEIKNEAFRRGKNKTQKEIADMLGVSQQRVSKIKKELGI